LPIFDCRLPIPGGQRKKLPHHFFNRPAAAGHSTIGNENPAFGCGRNLRCHPEPAALGGGLRMTLTPFGTLRLRFFPQPTR